MEIIREWLGSNAHPPRGFLMISLSADISLTNFCHFLTFQDEEWSPEFLDSIFENNTDLLSVFDDPNKISEITSDLMEYEEKYSPASSSHSAEDQTDLHAFLLNPTNTISSSASDSGLSSDNLDL